MLRLIDECCRHPQAGMLMQKEGRHAGGYAFPFCHIAVLSNINRSQIEREAQELTLLFPSATIIQRRTGHLGCARTASPAGKA